ncbi:heme exporter protein CcmB [Flavihumibacter petaseus]|uniref:Cytochrome C biogenesis protein n=1 Tax=Flavihumibacter petaseus NBRC 106054 TaxID=1220578 RepID=A0A0E9MUG7_9BACT|nr:heme exporter protein CcmB [Flavihumibacter petaseus]GAO41219.1 hypothetical protein FPE01S_01_02310 [Flavihumibacter petaseus NBRC 106054]
MKTLIALFRKDLLLEFRQQYSFYGVLLYVASTIFVLYLAMGQPEEQVWNGLFWMIQLFICVNGVAKSFLQESRGRMLYYYSLAGPRDFILSKLFFNAVLMAILSILAWALFSLFLGAPVRNGLRFFGIAVFGGFGLSLVFTFLSAIAARAQQNAALMAILGFPLIILQLMFLMKLSNTAFSKVIQESLLQMVLLLAGMDAMVIVLSLILFPFLWKD